MHATLPILDDVRAAAVRPISAPGRSFWLLAAGLGAAVAVGAVAYIDQFMSGLGDAGYSDHAFWGIYEANLVSFIAVSYGGALVSAILRLTQAQWRAPITRLAEGTALFSLLVGMGFALIHLGRPDRVWRMIVAPQLASPIVWDFVVITTYLVATTIFLYLPLIPDLAILRDRAIGPRWLAPVYRLLALNWRWLPVQRTALERTTMVVAIVIIPLAVFVHSVLSWAFAFTGRPGWDSTIFAPYFVVGALYAGIGMVILVVAGFRKGYHLEAFIGIKHFRYLAYLLVTLDLAYLYFTFTELITEGYVSNEETVPVLEALLMGQYAPAFWLFIFAGGLLPLLIVGIPRTRSVNGIVFTSAVVVVAMWLKRLLIVVPAVSHPLISGTWGVFQLTWIPIVITVAAACSIPLALMVFFKLFPILSIYEMEEIAAEAGH
jgi:Ni/Fe-hydrogenase subunit HybB-like protein